MTSRRTTPTGRTHDAFAAHPRDPARAPHTPRPHGLGARPQLLELTRLARRFLDLAYRAVSGDRPPTVSSWRWPAPPELHRSHQRGDAALRTVEARGTCSPATDCRRERNPSYDAARAAGAQLTGQRQDGPSQVPVSEQYPGLLTAARGFTRRLLRGGTPLTREEHDRQVQRVLDATRLSDDLTERRNAYARRPVVTRPTVLRPTGGFRTGQVTPPRPTEPRP